MSLGTLDVTDRGEAGPIDLLAAAAELMNRHCPQWREDGWDGDFVCEECDARLTDAESRTHVAHQLWLAGYLTMPA